MENADCVRFPWVKFEFKLHSTQDLIGHFFMSVSGFSEAREEQEKKGRRMGR